MDEKSRILTTDCGSGEPRKKEHDLQKMRPLAVAVLLVMSFISVAGFLSALPIATSGHVDYRSFYTAGYMVRAGHGSEIHDYEQTKKFQDQTVGQEKLALPYNHLAFESLLHVPFSLLSYRSAYFAFLVFNLIILGLAAKRFVPYLAPLRTFWSMFPLAFMICFLPVTMALIEGQDSIILLALMTAACVAHWNHKEGQAGFLIGLSLFKFQYALPIAFLFFVWRKWRFIGGFAIAALVVTLLSLLVLGPAGVASYAHYLPGASSNFSAANDVRLGIHPEGMPNLRGLLYALSGNSGKFTNAATAVLSGVVLVWAALRRPSLPGAILAAMLVSYHQMISDTTLLLVPLGVFLLGLINQVGRAPVWPALVAVSAFVAPSLLLFANTRFYLEVLPIMALFVIFSQFEPSPIVGTQSTDSLQTDTRGPSSRPEIGLRYSHKLL